MAVTIGSVTEGNANAEEIKNNSPDSELYEKNKKYLQGSLVKFNDKIYLAKRNVPSDVDLDNPYYWEIFMDAADSKRVDELFEKTGNLDELETESKDNLVNAINEAVLYTAQSLTEEQQAQARANIGADLSTKMDANNPVGTGSFSMNRKADTVIETSSHAEGYNTTASGTYSHAEGNKTTASGHSSHAEGLGTKASQSYSHAEGFNTTASGQSSHAEGDWTTASGLNSHAEGNATTASGLNSHAEGFRTTASGYYSHAEGSNTQAGGYYSHAEGSYTKARGNFSHVQGKYNIEDSSSIYADIIGNGTSVYERSNAATIDWSGNAWFAGDVYTGSTSGTNKDEGSKKLATEEYVNSLIASDCVQTNKENILGDNGSIISNNNRGNSLTISNGIIEQKNSNQDTVSLGNAKVVFSHDNDGSSSTRGNGTLAMYGKKGEEYFKFKGTNGDVKVSGIATPTLQNDAVNKGYVDLQIANIEIPTVPTNVSAFTNDAGYLTAVPSEYITETELNAKGYLTEHQSLADYALKSEIPSPYSLPTASATELGGVKADPATADDTQPVRIGDDGKLVTAAGGTDISLGLTSAAVGQTIKVKAIDESGKPTEWEAANMPSGGGHWETVLDTVWEQDVINPTAYDSETGIFTCAEGELNNLELNKEYVFFQQCAVKGVAYNTILNNNWARVTKLSDTTFSIDATPPTTFVPTNVKFSRGACLAVTNIDAKKIRLTLDGQFKPTATDYDAICYGLGMPYFAKNTGYQQIRSAYHAYQQVTAEVESPYRIVGEILCGFNAPSSNGNFHFKNNSFCCPLIPTEFPEGNTSLLTSDGTKIAKLYSTNTPWNLNSNAIINDYLKIISGTKVKLERWVE